MCVRDSQQQELVHRVLSVQEAMREDAFAHFGAKLSGAESTTLVQTRGLFQLPAGSQPRRRPTGAAGATM